MAGAIGRIFPAFPLLLLVGRHLQVAEQDQHLFEASVPSLK